MYKILAVAHAISGDTKAALRIEQLVSHEDAARDVGTTYDQLQKELSYSLSNTAFLRNILSADFWERASELSSTTKQEIAMRLEDLSFSNEASRLTFNRMQEQNVPLYSTTSSGEITDPVNPGEFDPEFNIGTSQETKATDFARRGRWRQAAEAYAEAGLPDRAASAALLSRDRDLVLEYGGELTRTLIAGTESNSAQLIELDEAPIRYPTLADGRRLLEGVSMVREAALELINQ